MSILYNYCMLKEHKSRRILILMIVIPLLLEVFFFNFRFWESLFWNRCGSVVQNYDNGILVMDNINTRVYNIFLQTENGPDVVPLTIYMSDEANTEFTYSTTEIDYAIPESRFIRVHPDGKVNKIRIDFNPYGEAQTYPAPVSVNAVVNSVRPFVFRIVRFAVILFIAFLIACFRPGSGIYSIKLFDGNGRLAGNNRIIIIFTCFIIIVMWGGILLQYEDVPINEYYIRNHVEAIYSYQAEALIEGHAELNIAPPDYLESMDNPYDPYLRNQSGMESGVYARGDFAYYDGKYYSYYGIVPTVLFYVPARLITGEALPNSVPVIILSIILIIAVFRLVLLLAHKYKTLSLGHLIIISTGVLFASFAIYCVQTPWIYSVAFISGLAFAVSALALWVHASIRMEASKKPDRDGGVILLLTAGSVAMSLAFGSRPSYILYVLLAFPVFYEHIRQKHFFSKKGMLNTCAVIVPALILCSAVLFYNYIRFDSFLDFGAKRNLSLDIMYHEASPATLVIGFIEYFLQLPNINATFPYFHSVYDWNHHVTDYQGVLFLDPVFGGIFMLAPFTLFALLCFKRRQTLKAKNMFAFAVVCIIIAAVLMAVDVQMGGISMRYQMDFAILLALPAAAVIMDYLSEGSYKAVHYMLIASVAITVAMLMLSSMAIEKPNPMIRYSTGFYYSLKYLIFVLR